ncbi:MAG: N-formylglutamate amidohydrolase, partial [Pseudomonadota bacterium]
RSADGGEVARRKAAFYTPYHTAITTEIDAQIARGLTPHLISIHSFTPQLRGRPERPWHIGILWDQDARLASPLMRALEAEGDLVVGDNQPYSGQLQGDCMYQHGTSRGLPHVLIEIRNDLISDETGQRTWAERLARLITPLVPATAKETA